MTDLKLVNNFYPYTFRSIGIDGERGYIESDDFPIGQEYTLTDGKFPFTNFKDTFSHTNRYHTLNGNIKVKIRGFSYACEKGDFDMPECSITVERASSGESMAQGKSKRRKTKRRKSRRRKSNRRR